MVLDMSMSSEDASKALTRSVLSMLVEVVAILWPCWALEALKFRQVQAVFELSVRHEIKCPLARLNTSI